MTKNYFKRSEEWCPCCKGGGLLTDFHDKLNEARDIAGVPFVLNSAFRCPEHNSAVGGSETSSHMAGLAVDIKAEDSRTRYMILKGLFAVGLHRIGVGKTFIHVDDDLTKPAGVVWLY